MQISENFAVNDSTYYTVNLYYVLLIFFLQNCESCWWYEVYFICAFILPVSLQQNASVEIGLVKMNKKTWQMWNRNVMMYVLLCLAKRFRSACNFASFNISVLLIESICQFCITSWWLWLPCIADVDIIFLPCGFFSLLSFCLVVSSIFFLFSANLSHCRLDVYHICTHGVALVRI